MKSLDKDEKRPYRFVDYDSSWPDKFMEIKKFLMDIFGPKAVSIEHIGSTSVPGMKAKPLIDVLVEVRGIATLEDEKARMIAAGYEYGENYIAPDSFIFFRTDLEGEKLENIHVLVQGSAKSRQFLVMRDYLRFHPERARAYSDLKEKNAALHPDDYPAYRAAKADFLVGLEKEAYEWDLAGRRD